MEFNHQLLAKGKRYSSKHTAILLQGKCSGLQVALKFPPFQDVLSRCLCQQVVRAEYVGCGIGTGGAGVGHLCSLGWGLAPVSLEVLPDPGLGAAKLALLIPAEGQQRGFSLPLLPLTKHRSKTRGVPMAFY